MKVSGLPKEHLELIANLEECEKAFLYDQIVRAPELVAQALTCLAHDYVQIGLEEKGHQLLLKADEIYPGYHKDKMVEHMAKDPDFNRLVISLGNELILVALSTARDGK